MSKIALRITAFFVTFGGVYNLIDAFIIHLGAQSGIIFIFLPVYQGVSVAIGLAAVLLTRRLGHNKSTSAV